MLASIHFQQTGFHWLTLRSQTICKTCSSLTNSLSESTELDEGLQTTKANPLLLWPCHLVPCSMSFQGRLDFLTLLFLGGGYSRPWWLKNILIYSPDVFITISHGFLLLTALSFILGSCPFQIFNPFVLLSLLVGFLSTWSCNKHPESLDIYIVIPHNCTMQATRAHHDSPGGSSQFAFFTRTSY